MLEERVNILEAKLRELEAVPEVRKHRDHVRDEVRRAADEQARRAAAEHQAQLRAAAPHDHTDTTATTEHLWHLPDQEPKVEENPQTP